MGNVASAASFDGDTLKSIDGDLESEDKSGPDESLLIENLHNKAHEVFTVPFSGIQGMVVNRLSPNFLTNHTVSLSNGDQAGYRFGATYCGHKQMGENASYPVFRGEFRPNGQMQAEIMHRFTPSLQLQYVAQMRKAKLNSQHIVANMKYNKWMTSIMVFNPELQSRQIATTISAVRQVTQKLALGSMFLYCRSPQVPSGQDGTWSLGGKYRSSNWTGALSIRPMQLDFHSSFHLRVNDMLQFSAELESDFKQQSNTATLGYQVDFPKGAACVKAQIDSNLNIAASFEKQLFPITFTLYAMGNQLADRYAVGFGVSLLV